jgi:hypothetical protein
MGTVRRPVGNAEWAKLKALEDEVGERGAEITITKSMAKAILVRALNDLNYGHKSAIRYTQAWTAHIKDRDAVSCPG